MARDLLTAYRGASLALEVEVPRIFAPDEDRMSTWLAVDRVLMGDVVEAALWRRWRERHAG